MNCQVPCTTRTQHTKRTWKVCERTYRTIQLSPTTLGLPAYTFLGQLPVVEKAGPMPSRIPVEEDVSRTDVSMNVARGASTFMGC